MKRTFLPLLFAAALIVSLSACGTDTNGTGSVSSDMEQALDGQSSTNADGVLGSEKDDNTAGKDDSSTGKDDSSAQKNDTSADGASTSKDEPIVRSATYDQMKRNAQVHDTDGDLTDGENAVTPGIAH